MYVVSSFICYLWNMANFDLFEDDYLSDIFITQQSKSDGIVSLEENMEYKQVFDAQYSDISDAEEDQHVEERLRCV